MNQEFVLYPALAMAMLTLTVGLTLFRARIAAVTHGEVNPSYFQYNRGAKLPGYLIRVEQNGWERLQVPLKPHF